jgi:hypothetical protein
MGVKQVLAAIALAATLGVGWGTAAATASGPWVIVPTPHPPGTHGDSEIWDANASGTEAWGVGSFASDTPVTPARPLAIHRVGGQWQLVATPNPRNSRYTVLFSVSVQSPSNAWAVGSWFKPGVGNRLLALHWNGHVWARTPITTPTGRNPGLLGVSARSDSDVWAVGRYEVDRVAYSLVEHWDGESWTRVPSPTIGGSGHSNYLWGVTALSATSVWVVGNYVDHGYRTLALHWNGAAWSQFPTPTPGSQNLGGGPFGLQVRRVFAVSATDIWAVGYYTDTQNREQTLTMHWNGARWRLVASPNPGGPQRDNELQGVGGLADGHVWAVGSISDGIYTETLLLEWSGDHWTRAAVPSPGGATGDSYLYGVAAIAPNDVTALGSFAHRPYAWTLGVHCC